MTRWRAPYVSIACECGRNLARATWQHYRQEHRDYIRVLSVSATAALPYEHRDPDVIGPTPTYQWQCVCGRTWTRRHERIAQFWAENIGAGRPERVITVTLGRDL